MSAQPELVTITVDGSAVQVPKGTGLVETALQAGVEIPVFCYEPRLGPPIGACRMCLVEVEGMPKLQAGCTLTAQDGMVVRTALTSELAAEGQEATLEFILVNHPLDCPVCDKGGECPLQDLTFRWGPGNTRMTFPKRTFEKPIPVSPLIALDRERCILCYRCTRFSENVAEDGRLVAVNRGSHSVIATFEDEPYRAHFSGNVIELCPVGALTSTPYRFEGRPWEIQNVPTVCGLCPVGCNVSATTREGKVKRIISRNHPEVDDGWLCDKGRFAYPALRAEDRVVDPLRRAGTRRFEELSWDDALDEAEGMLRRAEGRIVTALSGSETSELAYALSKLMRRGLGAHTALIAEETSGALDAFRAPLSAIRDAEIVVVLGDDPVVERAPVVDLWLRAARRQGAEIVRVGPDGDVPVRPGEAAATCRALARKGSKLGERLRASDRAILIWSGGAAHGGTHLAAAARALGFADKPASGAFYLPATPNGRGVCDAWACSSDAEARNAEPIGLLVISGDEAVTDPNVRALAEKAESVLAIAMFRRPLVGLADLVLPGTSYLERDGTMVNLEGRPQRLRRAIIPLGPDELAWIAKLAGRFGVELSAYPAKVFEELSAEVFGGIAWGELPPRAPLPPRHDAGAEPAGDVEPRAKARASQLEVLAYRPLFSGPEVERVPQLGFLRPEPEVELSAADAARLKVTSGSVVNVRSNGTSVELRAHVNPRLVAGVVRVAEDYARELGRSVVVRPA